MVHFYLNLHQNDMLSFKEQETERWFRENPNEERRFVFNISPESIVLDVGAYDGEWAKGIADRYGCNIFCFEPSVHQCDKAHALLAGLNVKVFPFALGSETRKISLVDAENSTSCFATNAGPMIDAEQRDVAEAFEALGLKRVDLIKINIEGAEFDLLERMIEASLIERCVRILVQFHPIVSQCSERRASIRESLASTHTEIFNYDFVWELWERSA